MFLITATPEFYNDMCDEIRLFIPQRRIELADVLPESFEGYGVIQRLWQEGSLYTSTAVLLEDGAQKAEYAEAMEIREAEGLLYKKHLKRLVKISVYRMLSRYFGKTLPWGSLTGIRPAKLARETVAEFGGEENAREVFRRVFDVSEEKTNLAFDIAERQRPFFQSVRKGEADIYISIPFCASRCHYCSFASNDIRQHLGLVDKYLERMFAEIAAVMDAVQPKIRSVYIGGGTPTALDAARLERLLSFCAGVFGKPAEYTVEAGRPDTITPEKLTVIKNYANRISVNPQTLNDETLVRIGRAHTAADFMEKFALAQKMGFGWINTDIIMGLPGETLADVERTIRGITALRPENVTVHTLAIKRSSLLNEAGGYEPPPAEEALRMTELCQDALTGSGWHPYYIYRQKYMTGNLENIGYSRPGYECAYNIDNMEETVDILAFGAGSISKKVVPEENRIERTPNVSDLQHYLARSAEMAQRKIDLFGSSK